MHNKGAIHIISVVAQKITTKWISFRAMELQYYVAANDLCGRIAEIQNKYI